MVKPTRILWNELIGFIFMIFTVVFGFKTGRLAVDYARGAQSEAQANLVRLVVAGFCTVVMLWFAVASFLRARKISRS